MMDFLQALPGRIKVLKDNMDYGRKNVHNSISFHRNIEIHFLFHDNHSITKFLEPSKKVQAKSLAKKGPKFFKIQFFLEFLYYFAHDCKDYIFWEGHKK